MTKGILKKWIMIFVIIVLFLYVFMNIYSNKGSFGTNNLLINIEHNNGVILNLNENQFLRQSTNDCSVYAINAVSNIVLWTWIDISWNWDKLKQFSFGILPFQLEWLIKDNWLKYDIVWYNNNNLNDLALNLEKWPIILLVYHKNYQHYFTIIGVDNDQRYIYDSLQDRLDDKLTIDSNWFAPWNLTLSTQELIEKWNWWWKYWLYNHYGVVVYK